MNIQPLIDYFERHLPLENDEKEILSNVFTERKLKRRQYLLQEGNISKASAFVLEGCFRMYLTDDNGKEHNLQFAIENWWIGDMGSFYSDEPSKLNIEAIENSVVLEIKKPELQNLYVEYPKFNRIFRVLTENALLSAQRRILQNVSSTAEERYLDFVKRYPQFFNRISNVQIASFIGVTPEFLSKIRKEIMSK